MRETPYKVTKEAAAIIRERRQTVKNAGACRRMMIVALRGEGKRNTEIAKIVGVHADSVGKIVKRYVLEGLDALLVDGRKGGNRRNMSRNEEEFLSPLKKRQ